MGEWFGYLAAQGNNIHGDPLHCNVAEADYAYPCPMDGKITRCKTWWTQLDGTKTFKLKVLRKVAGPAYTYHCVGESETLSAPAGLKEYILSSPITGVKAGDVIGVYEVTQYSYLMRFISGHFHTSSAPDLSPCSQRLFTVNPGQQLVLQAYVEPVGVGAEGAKAILPLILAKRSKPRLKFPRLKPLRG